MLMGRLFLQNNFTLLHLRFPLLFIVIMLAAGTAIAQVPQDSVGQAGDTSISLRDSIVAVADSQVVVPVPTVRSMKPYKPGSDWTVKAGIPFRIQILEKHPWYPFGAKAMVPGSNLHRVRDKDNLFYVLAGLVFLFAILKITFAKYFNDLFRVFFRTTMKQRQIREQLMQTPLPSLLFNVFFVLTGGMYLNFLFHDQGFKPVDHFWILYFYCCVGLAVIYFVKFVGLKICGWLFNIKGAADSYIFIVFIINKMIGILLLPVVVLLGFSGDTVFSVVMVLSWCCVGVLLLYRFILAFSTVRNEVRFNLFHFILYLAAFEVAPLLLIYRVLLSLV